MFSTPSLSPLKHYDVALHCIPEGMRAFCGCSGYKHDTTSEVVRRCILCQCASCAFRNALDTHRN